jgi:hypothetical protein
MKTDDPDIVLFSKHRIQTLITVVQNLFLVIMLMIPVVLLMTLELSTNDKLIIVTVFMSAFALIVTFCTGAKPHELFAATVA